MWEPVVRNVCQYDLHSAMLQGCQDALADYIQENLYILVGIAIAFAVFEVSAHTHTTCTINIHCVVLLITGSNAGDEFLPIYGN